MSTTESEFAYIKYAHQLQCYGHEFHPAKGDDCLCLLGHLLSDESMTNSAYGKNNRAILSNFSKKIERKVYVNEEKSDTEGRAVNIGPCARGVFLKYDSETPITYFNWPDIVNMMHSKKLFIVETSSLKSELEMSSIEDAKYVWQTCVDHHQFYRIGDRSKSNSISSEQRRKESSAAKRNSSTAETANGYPKGGEGVCNPAFNDSTLQEDDEDEDPESKRTSRESGIYGSSEYRVDKMLSQNELEYNNRNSFPSTSRTLQTEVSNINEDNVPQEFLSSSYKTFDKTQDIKFRHQIEPNTRRSYPRASSHSAGIDRTGAPVERTVSMIVPGTAGESCVDACSLQTMATSGYSTSTDSGLSNNKSPALSPMSPVSLFSSSSFLYDDYEVPSADEQCKQLEAVMNGGSLDIEFARIKLKDEQRSTASGRLPENQTKNRYPDILPYEESRVHLDSSKNGAGKNYINASFIKVKVSNKPFIYIAAQAPMQSTVSHFWQMIWEQNVRIIVMLYNKKEGPRECYRYWPKDKSDPSQPAKREFEEFEVTTQFVNKSSCCRSRGLKLRRHKEEQEKTIILLQFSHWPHNGIPADASILLDFMTEVESIRNEFSLQCENENTESPVVVHCRSGVGRTGVFILADLMIAHLQNQVRQPFNVARVLSKLRSQRMSLIRTVDQYRFVYALLIQYLKNSRLI